MKCRAQIGQSSLFIGVLVQHYGGLPGRPRTAAHYWFNKIMSRLRIEVEHGFWTRNGFYQELTKALFAGRGLLTYAVLILFAMWTCLRGNQTSIRLDCALLEIKD